jgi:hypothetical protein
MKPSIRNIAFALVACSLAFGAVACDGGSSADTTTTTTTLGGDISGGSSTTSTSPALTAIPANQIPGTHSQSISDDVDMLMRTEIGELMIAAEASRALPFIDIPTVTILDQAEFQARVEQSVSDEIDPVDIARDASFFHLMGMLDDDVDLGALLVSLYGEQVVGFYDPETQEMVVPAAPDGFSPLQRITVVHELVHALTDQHFDYADVSDDRSENGTDDEVSSLLAVVEGDATYQQFIFLENMDPADAVNAALESLSYDTSTLDNVPEWIALDLTFPYEQGLVFMTQIVSEGGLQGVDEVYQDPPTSTEQILEPRKYLRREEPEPLEPVSATLSGWDIHADSAFGEWGVRLILNDTLSPGLVTQAAAGWGNDSYRIFVNGDDVAIAWHYLAESVEDAEDLVNGLIAHARGPMGATSSQESGGGLLLEGNGTTVFIDRIDDEFYFLASTNRSAVGDLRSQLGL